MRGSVAKTVNGVLAVRWDGTRYPDTCQETFAGAKREAEEERARNGEVTPPALITTGEYLDYSG